MFSPKITQSEYGAWYTCKKQLIAERLVNNVRVKGRNKLIRAKISKYFDSALKDLPDREDLEKENLALFEKYAPKIVDFLIENDLLSEKHHFSYPIVFFFFVRYLASITDKIHELPVSARMGEFQSFLDLLSNMEKKELAIPLENQKELETVMKASVNLLPPEIFIEVFKELDMKFLAAITFRKKLLDRLVHWVAGSPERAQFLADKMDEFEQQKIVESEIESQEENDRILREQQGMGA